MQEQQRRRSRYSEINLENFTEKVVGISIKLNKKLTSFFSYYNPPNKELNINLFEYIQTNFLIILMILTQKIKYLTAKQQTKTATY